MAFGVSVLFLPGLNAGRSCARLRDGFSCVANPECGWCAHKFSCVPGNESGPLSSLRCDGNSSDVELHRAKVLDMNYRVPHVEGCTNEDRSKCARYHGPLYTYTADELNATGYRGVNYTYSAPEIWDVLCEAGGMRSSANSTKGSGHTPYWTSQARKSVTQASTSPPGLIPVPSLPSHTSLPALGPEPSPCPPSLCSRPATAPTGVRASPAAAATPTRAAARGRSAAAPSRWAGAATSLARSRRWCPTT